MTVAGLAFHPFSVILTALSQWAGGLVDPGGPRLPLIIGPAIPGGGCMFMWAFSGLSEGPARYWVTFLPGIVLLGIGMGITVAPLTTAVMSSVATHFTARRTGINNAVSRGTAEIAIAVAGALALFLFSNALQARTSAIPDLSGEARGALSAEASRLGAAEVPAAVPAGSVGDVRSANPDGLRGHVPRRHDRQRHHVLGRRGPRGDLRRTEDGTGGGGA